MSNFHWENVIIDVPSSPTTNQQRIILPRYAFDKCCIIFYQTVLVLLVLVYYGFAGKALINVSIANIHNLCIESLLWFYLLFVVLIGVVVTFYNLYINMKRDQLCTKLMIGLVIQLGFISWGIYELSGVSCVHKLRSSEIYYLSLIYILASTIVFCMISVRLLLRALFNVANIR